MIPRHAAIRLASAADAVRPGVDGEVDNAGTISEFESVDLASGSAALAGSVDAILDIGADAVLAPGNSVGTWSPPLIALSHHYVVRNERPHAPIALCRRPTRRLVPARTQT